MSLTVKQETFVHEWIKTGNKSEAYRIAYDAENMSDEAIKVEACRLSDNPNVSLTYKELTKAAQKRTETTQDTLDKMFREAFTLALSNDQASAMVAAAAGLGKLHGLNSPDKVEQTGKNGSPLHPVKRVVEYVMPDKEKPHG